MKILLCLNKDIYCCHILNFLLPKINLSEIKIYFSHQVGKEPVNNPSLLKLQKIEKDILSYQSTQKDFLNFEQIISKYKIQILDFKSINQDGLEYLENKWTPDLIISIRFGQIFKNKIIPLPKFGIINLHSAILPNYRGIMGTFWAMKDKQKQIGCTLHFINDDSIDTGNIIETHIIKANYKESLINNLMRIYDGAIHMLIRNIEALKNNSTITASPQNKNSGRYFSYPSFEEIEKSKIKLF